MMHCVKQMDLGMTVSTVARYEYNMHGLTTRVTTMSYF